MGKRIYTVVLIRKIENRVLINLRPFENGELINTILMRCFHVVCSLPSLRDFWAEYYLDFLAGVWKSSKTSEPLHFCMYRWNTNSLNDHTSTFGCTSGIGSCGVSVACSSKCGPCCGMILKLAWIIRYIAEGFPLSTRLCIICHSDNVIFWPAFPLRHLKLLWRIWYFFHEHLKYSRKFSRNHYDDGIDRRNKNRVGSCASHCECIKATDKMALSI